MNLSWLKDLLIVESWVNKMGFFMFYWKLLLKICWNNLYDVCDKMMK